MTGPFTSEELAAIAAQWEEAARLESVPEAASLFRRTAESIRIEANTGIVHCVCHLKPVEECRP